MILIPLPALLRFCTHSLLETTATSPLLPVTSLQHPALHYSALSPQHCAPTSESSLFPVTSLPMLCHLSPGHLSIECSATSAFQSPQIQRSFTSLQHPATSALSSAHHSTTVHLRFSAQSPLLQSPHLRFSHPCSLRLLHFHHAAGPLRGIAEVGHTRDQNSTHSSVWKRPTSRIPHERAYTGAKQALTIPRETAYIEDTPCGGLC